jgi:starch phosphorylase
MFYRNPEDYGRVMRGAIAVNGSFFNAQRMVSQYLANAWFREEGAGAAGRDVAGT